MKVWIYKAFTVFVCVSGKQFRQNPQQDIYNAEQQCGWCKKARFRERALLSQRRCRLCGQWIDLKKQVQQSSKNGQRQQRKNAYIDGGETAAEVSVPAENIPMTVSALIKKCGIMEEKIEPVRCTSTQNSAPTQNA